LDIKLVMKVFMAGSGGTRENKPVAGTGEERPETGSDQTEDMPVGSAGGIRPETKPDGPGEDIPMVRASMEAAAFRMVMKPDEAWGAGGEDWLAAGVKTFGAEEGMMAGRTEASDEAGWARECGVETFPVDGGATDGEDIRRRGGVSKDAWRSEDAMSDGD
jgi:hypothetical protein